MWNIISTGGPSLSNRNPNFTPTAYFTLPKNSFVTDRNITGRLSTSNVDARVQCVHSSSNTSWSLDTVPLSSSSTDNVFQSIDTAGSHLVISDLAQYSNDEYQCVLDNGEITYIGMFLNNGSESSIYTYLFVVCLYILCHPLYHTYGTYVYLYYITGCLILLTDWIVLLLCVV